MSGIDLEVRRGEVFAFLGPNGAGKTTTVEILEGFKRRSSGHVRVLGEDPEEAGASWRSRIGVVLQESQPDPGLTVREAVELYAGYYADPRRVDETLALVGLAEDAGCLATALSGGQRRRLDVALALVGPARAALSGRADDWLRSGRAAPAWKMIEGLRATGTTIFLTTHAMDEAAYLADRIAVIAGGRIIASGTPETIGGRADAASTISFTLPGDVSIAHLPPQLRRWSRVRCARGGQPADGHAAACPRVARPMGPAERRSAGRARSPPAIARGRLSRAHQRAEDHAMTRSPFALVAHQLRFDLRAFRRNRQASLSTLALPVLLLVILVSANSGETATYGAGACPWRSTSRPGWPPSASSRPRF